ncbi:MAG: extracellular solute-binding protein [Lachnospiraceae bacterium]|nr:extracellular solute-binding protein [Lachnospiraceae bacterium]
MRKKKLLGKALCLMLAGAMVLSLTSCKKGGKSGAGNSSGIVAQASDATHSKEAVFRMSQSFDCPFGGDTVFYNDGKIICFNPYYFADDGGSEEILGEEGLEPDSELVLDGETGEGTEEAVSEEAAPEDATSEEAAPEGEEGEEPAEDNARTEQSFFCAWSVGDVNGNFGEPVVYEGKYNGDKTVSIDSSMLTADGNLTLLQSEYDFDKMKYAYYVIKLSLDGKEISKNELQMTSENQPDNGAILSNGGVVVYQDNNLHIYDENLKKISEVPCGNISYVNNYYYTSKGKYYVTYFNEQYDSELAEVLVTEKRLGDPIALPSGFMNLKLAEGHDFYCKNMDAVSFIDIDGSSVNIKELVNFMDSDILGYNVNSAFPVDDETVLLFMDDGYDGTGIYKKVPPEEVKDKQIVTLGSIYSAPYDIQKRVLDYNKQSDSYRIRLVDYQDYMSSDDLFAAEKQFRNDILSKTGPDIILTSNMYNTGIYATKGVFVDMYPYFEKNGINKDDYLPNILEAGSYDGKLYVLMPQFSIECVAIKESVLNGKEGLTVQDMIQLEEQHNCKGAGFPGSTREELLTASLYFTSNSYYDVHTGECHFDSENFINTLKWLKDYPETVDMENYSEEMRNNEIALHKDQALAQINYFYNFRAFNGEEQVTFGDKIKYIGFPGANDPDSGVIMADVGFAISSQGNNQDAAFDFIKYYLSDEYQMPDENSSETWSLPISKKALDAKIAMECQKPFNYDEKTKKKEVYEESHYSYAKEDDVKVDPLTAERAEVVKQFVYSTKYFASYDQKIIDIIKEEAAPFFNGQKSAEDVAKIIQSRVSIYVMENQ